MKKILITTTTFIRWEGDSEPRFVLDFAKSISHQYDVTILAPWAQGACEREVLEGVKVIRYHYFPFRRWEKLCYPGSILGRIKDNWIRILMVPFLLLSLTIHLFFCMKNYDFFIVNWIIPQGIIQSFFKKPYMLICHGSDVWALNKGIMKILKKRALQRAKAVTVVSDELRQKVEELFDIKRIFIYPMGVDISKFNIGKMDKQVKKDKIILYVGRLDKIKGVEYLIEAMKYIDAKLWIVGDGILRKKLEMQAEKYREKIVFLGAIDHSKLPEIYAAADIFVAPSITLQNGAVEGFGLVLIEAMAVGIPVIGTNTGGIKDIISNGKNGFLVEEKNSLMIAEKVNELLSDPYTYHEMSQNAQNTVKKYDWHYVGMKYSYLIERCMMREA